jgi:hypothetical protein
MWKRMTVIEWLAALAIVMILLCLMLPPSWFPQQKGERRTKPREMRIVLPSGAAGSVPVQTDEDP